jgi:hypothetical protein
VLSDAAFAARLREALGRRRVGEEGFRVNACLATPGQLLARDPRELEHCKLVLPILSRQSKLRASLFDGRAGGEGDLLKRWLRVTELEEQGRLQIMPIFRGDTAEFQVGEGATLRPLGRAAARKDPVCGWHADRGACSWFRQCADCAVRPACCPLVVATHPRVR